MQRLIGGMFCVALLFLLGCGDDGPKVYPVKGKLTINGQPGKGVTVNFQPEDAANVLGSGVVQDDGTYTVTSGNKGLPGLQPGKYKVYLVQSDPGTSAGTYGPTKGAGKDSGKAPQVTKSFPDEWASPTTTPKEVEVKAESNEINIEV